MHFRKIAPGLHVATRRATNVYALVRDGRTTLVDTGEPAFAGPVLRALADLPPVADIVLTHGHYDHAGGAAAIQRGARCPVWAHPADASLLARGLWRRPARPSPTLHGRIATRLVADRFPDALERPADLRPIPEDGLPIEGIAVLPLPGHCAGQVALRCRLAGGRDAFLAGDAVMNLLGPREPILYEDRAVGLAGIRALAEALRDGDLLCPGHGRPLTGSQDLRRRLARLAERR